MARTPTEEFVGRIAVLREKLQLTEGAMARMAEIKSRTQVSRARSTGSAMNWDHVAALAEALHEQHCVSRIWLLFGEGDMMDEAFMQAAAQVRAIRKGKPSSRDGGGTDAPPRANKKSGRA